VASSFQFFLSIFVALSVIIYTEAQFSKARCGVITPTNPQNVEDSSAGRGQ